VESHVTLYWPHCTSWSGMTKLKLSSGTSVEHDVCVIELPTVRRLVTPPEAKPVASDIETTKSLPTGSGSVRVKLPLSGNEETVNWRGLSNSGMRRISNGGVPPVQDTVKGSH